MPENEFENEVQKKMEELTLTPSGKVWETVLDNIQQPKKRNKKLMLFFICLCFLVIATIFLSLIKTTYFFKEQGIDSSRKINKNKELTAKVIPFFKENKSEKTQTKTPYRETKKLTSDPIKIAPVTQQNQTIVSTATKSNINSSHKKIKNNAGKKLLKISAGSVEEVAVLNNEPDKNIKQSSPEKNLISPKTKAVIVINNDGIIKPVITKKIADTIESKSAGFVKNKTKVKNKWMLGITAAIGKSATGNGYFASNNNRDYNYSSPVYNSGGIAGNSYSPSTINSGFMFTVGLFATHKLTSKTTIVIGFNYKLLRANLLVGKDSSINNAILYSVGNTKTYHNNYHFIELPVTFQAQLFSIKKHPVFIDAGLSFSHLIHTNSLQYNSSQGNYYINNDLFNKTIIGLSAGLSINITNSKSAPFLLGPQIYYSPSTLANTGLYANGHYSFAGIRLQKMLSKN